jgi:hypothetical protein
MPSGQYILQLLYQERNSRVRCYFHEPSNVAYRSQRLKLSKSGCYWKLINSCLPDFDIIRQQPAVNSFGGVGHEGPSFETGLLEKPRQGATVVQVETEIEKGDYRELNMVH